MLFVRVRDDEAAFFWGFGFWRLDRVNTKSKEENILENNSTEQKLKNLMNPRTLITNIFHSP